MDKDQLLEIGRDWSFWDRRPPKSVARAVELPKALSNRTTLVIQGVRRCGKSTLLTQMIGRYGLERKNCLFVNFEDPRLAGHLNFESLENLTRAFADARPNSEPLTVFLDEIQWVTGWERWLASKLERPDRFRFVISGSNAHLLSGELSTVLTGRHVTVELFPFDPAEFRKLRPKASLADYLHHGGFPEPVVSEDGDLLLRQYFSDILQRDVRERVGARSSLSLRQVVQMVFESAGSELSLRRIAAASGIAVETVAAYLEACEQAYLLFSCPWFAFSERKRSHRNRKYYPVDTALRRVSVTRAGQDMGKALECATFVELRKRGFDVFYWRDAGEVDFVVQSADRPTPIQVTLDGAAERHMRSLDAFHETFPTACEPVIVTMDNFPNVLANISPLNLATA
ncbi:MAG: ATP-binding protein [Gammaproteobacteria bacterium]|nr:ATP-binding protein [Gammaproteobacteria bacterium]MCY3689955.1 ATP-binding protein [Gammaproteobacteria bacterium]MXX06321.1 ATP-binding protein [Gammaproteobacteria bacterium]MYE29658.1 ATP-binding protein [Gammaproteobacteria bacterium]